MTTAQLYVVGSTHQARFGESFDADLEAVIDAAREPARASGDLDELGLLGVLAHFAAAGRYDPNEAVEVDAWGLEVDADDRRLRYHVQTIHYSATSVDVVVFEGTTVTPEQTIVATVSIRPEALT